MRLVYTYFILMSIVHDLARGPFETFIERLDHFFRKGPFLATETINIGQINDSEPKLTSI